MEVRLLRCLGRSPELGLERSIWAADSAGGGVGGGGHSTVPSGGRGLCPLPSPRILLPLSVWKGEGQLGTGVGTGSRPTEGSLLSEQRSTIPKDAQRRENSREERPGALLFPSWDSSLSLGGFCRAAGPELCLVQSPGTPKVSPYLPPSRALCPGSAREVPPGHHRAVPWP